jgi:Arc/MetJ-type ribon-helix-helix transcriptional regulator
VPTRNVNLTDALDHFVAAKVASGRYDNEQEYEAKLANLRSALEEGQASGDAEDYSLDGLIAELDHEKA